MIALGFLLLATFINGFLLHYQRTAVQAALLDGARQGSRSAQPTKELIEADCASSVRSSLAGTLRGSLERREIQGTRCELAPDGKSITVRADVEFTSLVPSAPFLSPLPAEGEIVVTVQRRPPGGGAP